MIYDKTDKIKTRNYPVRKNKKRWTPATAIAFVITVIVFIHCDENNATE